MPWFNSTTGLQYKSTPMVIQRFYITTVQQLQYKGSIVRRFNSTMIQQ